jgi:hypothetical protein
LVLKERHGHPIPRIRRIKCRSLFLHSLGLSSLLDRGKIALWTIGCSDDQDIPVWGDREDLLPFSVRRGFPWGVFFRWNRIWKPIGCKRANSFMWLVAHGRPATGERRKD